MLYFSFISKKEWSVDIIWNFWKNSKKKEALALCKMYIFTIK